MKILAQAIRFAGIGFLNTAIDFAVFNLVASLTGIYSGPKVIFVNSTSFVIAVLHSYFWNKYWAFAQSSEEHRFTKNFEQLIAAGILGAAVIAAAIFGAKVGYGSAYYFGLLVAIALGEVLLWKIFGLKKGVSGKESHTDLVPFVVISLVSVFINSGIVAGITTYIHPVLGINKELWANLAKVAATGVALIWNFLGYKIIVFKR